MAAKVSAGRKCALWARRPLLRPAGDFAPLGFRGPAAHLLPSGKGAWSLRRTEGQGKAWRVPGLVLGTPQGKNSPTVKKKALASICRFSPFGIKTDLSSVNLQFTIKAMIKTYRHKGLRLFFEEEDISKLPQDMLKRIDLSFRPWTLRSGSKAWTFIRSSFTNSRES